MAVKADFKQTEIGATPTDWLIKGIGEVATIEGGFAFSSRKFVKNGKYQIIKMSNLYGGQLDLNRSASFLDELETNEARYILERGDILITLTGTTGKRDYGFTHLIQKETNLLLNQRVARIKVNDDLSAEYIAFQLASPIFLNQFFGISKGGTGNQTNVGTSDVSAIKLPIPSLSEQRAIANALSDVDRLISGLDQLIVKKRDIKKAAMQQLLTGRQRLPGSKGKWETKKIGDILKVRHGKSQHTVVEKNGQYPILATGGEIGRTNTFLYDRPSVLIGRKGTIDRPQYLDIPFWTIDTLFFTEVNSKSSVKFIYYKFTQIEWRNYSEASGVPSLNAKTIENIEIAVPDLDEQNAIASLLTDLDREIFVLEQRRDKTKLLKQGMMQELLTGKTRLV